MAIVPFKLISGNSHATSADTVQQPLDTESLVARLLDMAEWVRQRGSQDHADRLLLTAWSIYDDPRGDPRVPVFRRGSVLLGSRSLKVICVDLSLSGALLKCRLSLPDSGTTQLKLRGLFVLPAAILEGGFLARIKFEHLSEVQERALGAFLGARMHSPRFIPQLLSSDHGGRGVRL